MTLTAETLIELDCLAILEIAELRYDLLVALNRLCDPAYALEQLCQFKEDVAIGAEFAINKWRDYLAQLQVGLKYLEAARPPAPDKK